MAVTETVDAKTSAHLGDVLPTYSARGRLAANLPIRDVAIVVDPTQLRNFHYEVATRLKREAGARVSLRPWKVETPLPASLELLLALETMVSKCAGPRLSDRLNLARLLLPEASENDRPDLSIDFCGDAAIGGRKVFRVLFDGFAGERALMGALLAGRMPTIEIEDTSTGRILSRGVPAADNAGTLVEALECALARIVDLIVLAVRGCESLAAQSEPTKRTCGLRDIVAFETKMLPHKIVGRLYRLCCYAPHWRTSWRFVDGSDVWDTRSLSGTPWTVIPDPGFRFYADPFPFRHEGKHWIFVEDFDHRSAKGIISVIPFDADGQSGPARPVLEEPWHLSYPFVFSHAGQIWIMPESSADRSVHLYRADRFPDRWVRQATLLTDIEASDATMLRHDGRYWLFAATRSGRGSWSDSLSIFSAPDPLGPWKPHDGNPVLIDQATARPAGTVFKRNGKLCRPVQDCARGYGTGIGLVEIVRLDQERYEQELLAVVRPEPHWPGKRLHTLNRAGRLECIDGSAHSPRSRLLARGLESWSGRRDLLEAWHS